MLAGDNNNTVLSEASQSGRNNAAYTVYGHRASDALMDTALGYNGVWLEVETGGYALGSGYRFYSPKLMKFFVPDVESPFEKGGPNAYAYCEGDPMNYVDPTGTWAMPSWMGRLAALFTKSSAKDVAKQATRTARTKAPKVPNVNKKASSAAPSRSKGTVQNGRIKGGFFEDLKNGVEKRSFEPKAPRTGRGVSQVAGASKFDDSLANPASGLDRLKEGLKQPWLKESVVDSHRSVTPNGPSVFQSAVNSNAARSGSDLPSMFEATASKVAAAPSRNKQDLESVNRAAYKVRGQ
ncbi:RHS repeat-associated core domain-containing protein [Pseudomonas sp. GW101-3H06]|jgi:RHS repeat-associated protein|uniref:RHS repeat-associated core domain-containing protein n=1 Tax=Pseudomonas sp. GW101-3H06 TaxID=2751347 RepID=UPI001A90F116|nr:RHS repeat-associated core domain-containing protein [Pseudomonas sp. GW101-3H06]